MKTYKKIQYIGKDAYEITETLERTRKNIVTIESLEAKKQKKQGEIAEIEKDLGEINKLKVA